MMSCPEGKIFKEGYEVQGYVRADGTHVNSFSVGATCITDRGALGKGERILPPLGDELHLKSYGYSIDRSEQARRKALREASKDNDPLEVLRRINLIRNYQAKDRKNAENRKRFDDDVEYMKDFYARWKKQHSQSGGHADIGVYESHNLDGMNIVYRTMDETDSLYLNDMESETPHLNKFFTWADGDVIGVFANNKLQGYFKYNLDLNKHAVMITHFKTLKGKRSLLYVFIEKYFSSNGFNTIYVVVDTKDKDAIDNLNLWTREKFSFEKVENSNFCKLTLVKII